MSRLAFILQIGHLLRRLARPGAAALLLAAAVVGGAAPAAASPPKLPVAAAAAFDLATGRFVYAYRADVRRPMASTTKIMTAKVVLDSGISLSKTVRVGSMHLRWDESGVGLKEGELLTVDELLQALLVASANDAARTLAVAVDGSEQAFVARMNATAVRLHLTRTRYRNPHGMDAAGHYTTARDLTLLAVVAMDDARFADYVRRRSIVLPDPAHKGRHLRARTTDTFMLAHPTWVFGVKTGYTDEAGSCLVSAGTYGGQRMIVTVLGAPDPSTRNDAVLALYRYARSLYTTWRSAAAGTVVRRALVPYARGSLALRLEAGYSVVVPPGAGVASTVTATRLARLPVAGGQALGTVAYAVDGKARDRRQLVAARSIPVPDWQTRLRYRVWHTWERPASLGDRIRGGWERVQDAFRAAGRWFSDLF